jgi:hypothetical protein
MKKAIREDRFFYSEKDSGGVGFSALWSFTPI